MFSNKPKRGPFANDRVNPHDRDELNYWCQKFSCTDLQLKNAVTAMGTDPDAVRHFLKGRSCT